MKFLTILILILTSTQVMSAVNMRNGSYNETWVDFIDPEEGYEMKIERFYSSRSLFIGLYGFGWCSNLETHLTITSDGIINLTECGGGLEVTYYPKDFDLGSPKDTINAIISDFKKTKRMSLSDVKNLRAQLTSNTKMRFQNANRLGLVDIKKIKTRKNTFLAKSKGFEKITFTGRFYERKKFNGFTERFNKKGKLIQISNPVGLWLKINYKGERIAYIVDKKGRRLNFSYATDGKLSRVYNGRKLESRYKFQGENLVEVTNMWSKTYKFSYDANHNMTQVDFPDKSKIKMTYNLAKDWIKSYLNRLDCKESFDFLLSKDDPQNHYWGTFKRKCKGQKESAGRHEFWYKNYSFSKNKYLHRVQENYNATFKDIYFHPFLGRPVSIRENNVYHGFAYYINGLVNKQEFKKYSSRQEILNWHKISFKYNFKRLLITETLKTTINKLGKTTGKEKTLFGYNRTGLLKTATKPKGKFVSIDYNNNGKINRMKNHQLSELKLTYKIGVNKPSQIEQLKVGKVKITYNTNGDVESVESEGQRNIATSVIEKFLEMISFLGPLGEQLKI